MKEERAVAVRRLLAFAVDWHVLVLWGGVTCGSVMIATGGSETTRRLLPVIGFRPHGELYGFARPVRPLRQALTAAERSWKSSARLLRNACSAFLILPGCPWRPAAASALAIFLRA